MAGPASSTPAEVRVVHRPTGMKDRQTTLSVATTAPPERTRTLAKDVFSTRPASAEQTEARHRPRGGPKDAGTCPISMPLDPEPVRRIEEAWY